jgi:hypothetical protein
MRLGRGGKSRCAALLLAQLCSAAAAQTTTPLAGHYPPGQSGIRGAAAAQPGWSITNFSRFFSNLQAVDADGDVIADLEETRYANITMITWTTPHELLGMRYGMMAGIPFSTGNLNPSADDSAAGFGLGDILLTPIALYGERGDFDYTLQLTLWSSSGRFDPGSPKNRSAGFWSLVYSLGGVWYLTGDRRDWSASAIARIEQNFEQEETGISPGHDLVIDWGVGKVLGEGRFDVGVSGFATWQLTEQSGGTPAEPSGRYRYFGIGPEASMTAGPRWAFRVRAHWEFAARNAVRGNNLWLIANYAL